MRWTRWPLDLSGAWTTIFSTNSRKSAGVKLGGLGVLLHNFQKALDIDRLRLSGVYDSGQILYGLFQRRLLLLIALGQLGKAFLTQLTYNMIFVKPLDDDIQRSCSQ